VDVGFGTWSVGSLYRAGSLETVGSGLAKYNLHLLAVQEVRCVEVGSQPADDFIFLYGNGRADHHIGTGFFLFTKESYQQLRG
jgi:hypothetical protein